ncbi:DUF397 domain-containing protein, partial [Streptomyces sp. NPDC059533]|uniref:DUF397 domain-containing protein n=1 Tax=Streptomyces sp. NPDC059533 TaxID=3346858 RepID=UPI0036C86A9E
MSIKPSFGDLSALEWVKSSYSASNSNECVEVAVVSEAVLVRDSKDVVGGGGGGGAAGRAAGGGVGAGRRSAAARWA